METSRYVRLEISSSSSFLRGLSALCIKECSPDTLIELVCHIFQSSTALRLIAHVSPSGIYLFTH